MSERQAFNFYKSYADIIKKLSNEQAGIFIKALAEIQFLERDIDDISFDDPILDIVFTAIKHQIKQQVEGYKNKQRDTSPSKGGEQVQKNTSTPPTEGACLPPPEPPCQPPTEGATQPPCQPPSGQEKEEEKEKEKEQEKERVKGGYRGGKQSGSNEPPRSTSENLLKNPSENNEKIVKIPDKQQKTKRRKFIKPSLDEIKAYIAEKGYLVDAEAFYDFYEMKDWIVGKTKMKDWKAAVRLWHRRNTEEKRRRDDDDFDLERATEKARALGLL